MGVDNFTVFPVGQPYLLFLHSNGSPA